MSTNGSNAVVLSLAGFLAALPAGLQPMPFLTGLTIAVLGTALRAGSEIQKAAEGSSSIKMSAIAGWMAGGCTSAPGVTVAYLILLNVCSVPANIPELFFLLPLSYYGQRGTIWLLNTTTNAAKGLMGAAFKSFPTGNQDGDGK